MAPHFKRFRKESKLQRCHCCFCFQFSRFLDYWFYSQSYGKALRQLSLALVKFDRYQERNLAKQKEHKSSIAEPIQQTEECQSNTLWETNYTEIYHQNI